MCIPKYWCNKLASRSLHLSTLWSWFITCSPLGWLSIGFRYEMMEPCFIHYHIWMHKFGFIPTKQLETQLRIINLLFLIDCELMWHPLCKERAFSYPNILSRYVQHIPLISLESQISQSTSLYGHPKLFCGFYVFLGNSLFEASTSCIILGAHFTLFKLSKPFLSGWFSWCRVRIMFIKPTVFFFAEKQCFINTWNSFLSIVFKLTKVASLKIRYLLNY